MVVQKAFFSILFLICFYGTINAQKFVFKQFKTLSCPEKRWVIFHPFVAKKAFKIAVDAREKTLEIKQQKFLIGVGNGDQLDAFRHAYWMAMLAKEIGERKSKKLGVAHEKGNYKQYNKGMLEDEVLPDKISCEMDLFNNSVGLKIAKVATSSNLLEIVLGAVKKGDCKIIKTDAQGYFLDSDNNVIPKEELSGKWENRKVLVNSNY